MTSILGVAAYLVTNRNELLEGESGIRFLSVTSRNFIVRPRQTAPTELTDQSNDDHHKSARCTPVIQDTSLRTFTQSWFQSGTIAEDRELADSLSKQDKSLIVRDTLQLIRLTEFFLLIEFAEVIVPVVYCTYYIEASHHR